MCHIALLLPLLTLPMFWFWPMNVAVPLYIVVLGVSAVMYYFAYAAMRRPVLTGNEHLIGNRTDVRETEPGKLYVRLDGERWQIQSAEELHAGDEVEIDAVKGARLLVHRYGPGGAG